MRGKISLIVFVFLGLSLLYGNCQNSSSGQSALSSRELCRQSFSKSYYVFTRQNCVGCHYESNLQGKGFADSNVYTAFTDFEALTELRVRTYALDPSHQAGITGPQNLPQITTARTLWVNSGCSGEVVPNFVTIDKPVDISSVRLVNPNNPVCVKGSVANPNLCLVQASDFKVISWDLATDLSKGSAMSGVTFSIKVAIVDDGADTTAGSATLDHNYGLLLTSPTLANNSGSNVHIAGINFNLNGARAYDGTTFSIIDQVVANGATKDLALYTTDPGISPVTTSGVMLLSLGKVLATGGYTLGTLINVLERTTATPSP